jgi:hypothetical protein
VPQHRANGVSTLGLPVPAGSENTRLARSAYRGGMAEPEVFDWDEWENGKIYKLSNDELLGALLSEVSALRKRVSVLEKSQPR